MKRCFLVLIILLYLCPNIFAQKYIWKFSMVEPTPAEALQPSDDFVPAMTYKDEFITASFWVEFIPVQYMSDNQEFGFALVNKTNRVIKVNWDDLSWISPDGTSSRVIHRGINFANTNAPQVPTVIPPGANIKDILIPEGNIFLVPDGPVAGWHFRLLFPVDYLQWDGREFSVYFPLEINGSKKDYLFKFKITVSKVAKK